MQGGGRSCGAGGWERCQAADRCVLHALPAAPAAIRGSPPRTRARPSPPAQAAGPLPGEQPLAPRCTHRVPRSHLVKAGRGSGPFPPLLTHPQTHPCKEDPSFPCLQIVGCPLPAKSRLWRSGCNPKAERRPGTLLDPPYGPVGRGQFQRETAATAETSPIPISWRDSAAGDCAGGGTRGQRSGAERADTRRGRGEPQSQSQGRWARDAAGSAPPG